MNADRRKIYIVNGTCGEFSDRITWVVCAYCDETTARKHADNAMQWAHAEQNKYPRYESPTGISPYDSSILWSYTGTDYYVTETEILGPE